MVYFTSPFKEHVVNGRFRSEALLLNFLYIRHMCKGLLVMDSEVSIVIMKPLQKHITSEPPTYLFVLFHSSKEYRSISPVWLANNVGNNVVQSNTLQ